MAKVVFEGSVCIDCALAIANDDVSGMSDERYREWADGCDRIALYELGDVVMACSEDCEGRFSWSPCDHCGSELGGDRHPIAVFARAA